MGIVAEIIIPLFGALVAIVATAVKTFAVKRSMSEIVINMGDGSKIRVDGSEEAREKVRRALTDTLQSEVDAKASKTTLQ